MKALKPGETGNSCPGLQVLGWETRSQIQSSLITKSILVSNKVTTGLVILTRHYERNSVKQYRN